jgi:hypothetical protein
MSGNHLFYLPPCGEVEKHRSVATMFFGWGAVLGGVSGPPPEKLLRNFSTSPQGGR